MKPNRYSVASIAIPILVLIAIGFVFACDVFESGTDPGKAPLCRFEARQNPLNLCVQFLNDSDNWIDNEAGHEARWRFGDSNSSSDNDPLHCYALAGSYTADLEVTNPAGKDQCQQRLEVD